MVQKKLLILTSLVFETLFYNIFLNLNHNVDIHSDINISALDVLTLAGEKKKIFLGDSQEITLIYIFNNSYGSCENNIIFWNRLFAQVSKQAEILGLCFYNLKEANFIKEARDIRFPIYIAANNTKRFLLSLSKGKSVTILFFGKKIYWHKSGDLSSDDYIFLKNLILGGN